MGRTTTRIRWIIAWWIAKCSLDRHIPPSHIHVMATRRLAPDDPPGALEGIGVVDPFSAVADSDHGPSDW